MKLPFLKLPMVLVFPAILIFAQCTAVPQARAMSSEVPEIQSQSIPDATSVEPESSQEKTPTFRVETRFIEVPLLVESLDGEDIPILTKDDFRVYEDDSPREIIFFSHEITTSGLTKLRDDAIKSMQSSYPTVPLLPVGADQQEYILGRVYLLLDDISSNPATFLRIKQAAEKFILEHFSPLRPISLHLASDASADVMPSRDMEALLDKVRRAVPKFEMTPISSEESMSVYEAYLIEHGNSLAIDVAELRLAATLGVDHINDSGEVDGEEPLDPEQIERDIPRIARQINFLNQSQTNRVIDGLRNVISSAAADPLRYPKTIIFLSPGLLMEPDDRIGYLLPLVDRANRNGIRVFAVDALGLDYTLYRTPQSNISLLRQNPQLQAVFQMHADGMDMERQSILHMMSRGTGGSFLHSTNDLAGAVGTAVRTASSIYYLGFLSSQPLDGRYHHIRTTSSVGNARIHARQGYFATERNSPETMTETSPTGENWQTLLGRAEKAAASGEVSVLVPTMEQLVRRFPNEANYWYTLGVANFKQGNNPRAIEALQRSYALAPDDKDIGAALSRVLMVGGYPDAAADTVTELIKRHPSDADLLINLGLIYETSSRTAEAYQVYRRLLDLGSNPPVDVYLALIRTSASLGRKIEASLFMTDYLARGGDRSSIEPWIEMLDPDLR